MIEFSVNKDILCRLNEKNTISYSTGYIISSTKYRKAKENFNLYCRSIGYLGNDILRVTITQGFRTDIDAYIKIILDGMQGAIYDNDKQVEEIFVKKVKGKKDISIKVERI